MNLCVCQCVADPPHSARGRLPWLLGYCLVHVLCLTRESSEGGFQGKEERRRGTAPELPVSWFSEVIELNASGNCSLSGIGQVPAQYLLLCMYVTQRSRVLPTSSNLTK